MHLQTTYPYRMASPLSIFSECEELMDKEPTGYTYADLRRVHIGRLEEEQKSLQQIRNHTSTLQLFMRAIGKRDIDTAFDDFSAQFDENMLIFHAWSVEQGLSVSTIANRISCLRAFRDTTTSMVASGDSYASFRATLSFLMEKKGFDCGALAKLASVKYYRIYLWLRGVMPNMRSIRAVGRLEKALGVNDGCLKRIVQNIHNIFTDREKSQPVIAWRESQIRFQQYYYNDPIERIKLEWAELVRLHTSPYLISGLQRNSMWRVKDTSKVLRRILWYGEVQRGYCVTAEIRWKYFGSFFGFLLLDTENGGKGFREESLTLALAGEVNLVVDFVEFRRSRSGVYTSEIEVGLQFFMTLLRKQTGFLWQHPQYGSRLPSAVPASDWCDWCEKSHAPLREVVKGLKKGGHIKKGRDPKKPIQDIISVQHPIRVIFTMIERMERQLVLSYGSYHTALKYRNILLVKMMVSNPLRAYNYSIMTYNPDNTGNLYQGEHGEWRLRFAPEDFKNQKGAASSGYDVVLSAWLYDSIESYVSVHRLQLRRADATDYLFLAGTSGRREDETTTYWLSEQISMTIKEITKRFIPNCPGFGSHAFRHIVATDFIKNNPNGFQIAANILHDKLETVMREYAHIKVADGFSHWTNYFDSQVEAVKGANHE